MNFFKRTGFLKYNVTFSKKNLFRRPAILLKKKSDSFFKKGNFSEAAESLNDTTYDTIIRSMIHRLCCVYRRDSNYHHRVFFKKKCHRKKVLNART
jgi:hypothetical protein